MAKWLQRKKESTDYSNFLTHQSSLFQQDSPSKLQIFTWNYFTSRLLGSNNPLFFLIAVGCSAQFLNVMVRDWNGAETRKIEEKYECHYNTLCSQGIIVISHVFS